MAMRDFLAPTRDPAGLAPARLERARQRARRLRSLLDAGGERLDAEELRATAIDAVEELDAVLTAATALLGGPSARSSAYGSSAYGSSAYGSSGSESSANDETTTAGAGGDALEALRKTARSIHSHARALLDDSASARRPASDWRHLEPLSRACERLPTLLDGLDRPA